MNEIECKTCHISFFAYVERKFCSHKCFGMSIRKPIILIDKTCPNCSGVFHVSKTNALAMRKRYCSHKCYVAHNLETIRHLNKRVLSDEQRVGKSQRDNKKYYQRHIVRLREKYRLRSHIRRASLQAGKFSTQEWKLIVKRQEGKCNICHRECPLTVDHIIPISKWKEWMLKNPVSYKCNEIQNIQGLCLFCNLSKGGRILENNKIPPPQRKKPRKLQPASGG